LEPKQRGESLVNGDIKGFRFPDRVFRAVIAALVIVSVAACRHYANQLERTPGSGDDVVVVVDNRDFSDATVYVYWNGFRTRAGIVEGKSLATFRIRWRADQMQLEADFVGAGTDLSDIIQVLPGDEVKWLIQPKW